MSDRVTSAEIEDVLSSIRRLVSIDDRRSVGSKTRETANVELSSLTAKPDESNELVDANIEQRLVLSHRFRVAQPEETMMSEGQRAVSSYQVTANPAAQSDALADPKQADLELVDTEITDPSLHPVTDEAWDPESETDTPPNVTLALEEWHIETEAADPEKRSPPKPDKMLAEDAAENEEPDQAPVQVREFHQTAFSTRRDLLPDETSPQVLNELPVNEPETKILKGAAQGTKELEARIAEVEAAVAARDDQWEPDGSEPEANQPPPITSLPWRHAAETEEPPLTKDKAPSAPEDARERPEALSQPEEVPQPLARAAQKDAEDHWYSEDTIVDEAALRDLVSEIVRQELQGSLGERITRNVRKLVRREIHRAMMGQEFD